MQRDPEPKPPEDGADQPAGDAGSDQDPPAGDVAGDGEAAED